MPIFDEASAVEAPKEGSPEYLIMVCQQHMAWLTVYAEGMTQADWRDMQDRLVSQIGKLVTDFDALAALKPYLGGWQDIATAPKDGRSVLVWRAPWKEPDQAYYYADDTNHAGWYRTGEHWTDAVGGEPFQPTHWMPLPPSPDKGGE